jgi:dolichol kinase
MALAIQEVSRKLLHLVAIIMPLSILYLPEWAPYFLGTLSFTIVMIEWIRFRHPFVQRLFHTYFGIMMREEENQRVTGATWIILSAFLLSLFFIHHPSIPFVALTMFILGDSAAALVGMTLGRIKIGKKSLEGSLACFSLCLFLCYAVFPYMPGVERKILHHAIVWLAASFVTIFELFPLRVMGYRIDDNLSVPLLASIFIWVLSGMG